MGGNVRCAGEARKRLDFRLTSNMGECFTYPGFCDKIKRTEGWPSG